MLTVEYLSLSSRILPPEGQGLFLYFACQCIPNALNSSWYRVGSQQICFKEIEISYGR